jgi:pimeloyl-ACP methyl ester carboxylesterase
MNDIMKPIVRNATLAGGLVLQYAQQGDPAGLPVIFLHGVTDSWRSFELLFAHLPYSFRAIAVSQRGHGDSDWPEGGYRAQDFSDDLAAFMDALAIQRAIIVGHSMGTQVAQRFAIDHPDRVFALALIGAFATMRGNAGVEQFWASDVSRLTDPIDPAFALAFQESTLAQPIPPSFLDTAVAESLKVPAFVWRAAFESFLAEDVTPDLPRIDVPTLIIWGDSDAFCSRKVQDALLDAIPHSTLAVYAGAGHAVHWEEPRRVAQDVAALIDETIASIVADRAATSRALSCSTRLNPCNPAARGPAAA